ncbi:MAG TPA: peptidoglycan-binding domain-containing protein [Stellaceae bacterium]|nr:peptidoglycan-binding domain-containing protein [Stellaceae bacterium]
MKKLMLATVSAAALGLAGIAPGFAQTATSPSTNPNPPATSMPTQQQGAQGDQGLSADQGAQAQQGSQTANAPVRLSRRQVEQVQQQLKSAGLYKGGIDGRMGPETRTALRSFQQQNNLQATGRIDQQTMAALQNGATGSGGSAMTPGTEGQQGTAATNGTDSTMQQQDNTANPTPMNNQTPANSR